MFFFLTLLCYLLTKISSIQLDHFYEDTWFQIDFFILLEYLDKLLESRIRLQKSMQTTNTMPQNEQMKIFLREGGPQIQEAYKQGISFR